LGGAGWSESLKQQGGLAAPFVLMQRSFMSERRIAFARAALSFRGALLAQHFMELDAIEVGDDSEQILE
jgi:hypothetical protein